jgi:hypothetical protein
VTKKSTSLPFTDCTLNVRRWSQGKLITTSDIIDAYSNGERLPAEVVQICAWGTDGKLIGQIQALMPSPGYTMDDVVGKPLTLRSSGDKPLVFPGFLPREQNTIYVLELAQGEVPPVGKCEVAAVDLKNPTRQVRVVFDAHAQESDYCVAGDTIELDLSTFTIEKPDFRFRVHHQPYPTQPPTVTDWTQVR